jgi:hypothetical protein
MLDDDVRTDPVLANRPTSEEEIRVSSERRSCSPEDAGSWTTAHQAANPFPWN